MADRIVFVVGDGGIWFPLPEDTAGLAPVTGALAALQRLSAAGYTCVMLMPTKNQLQGPFSADELNAYTDKLLATQGIQRYQFATCMHGDDACDCRPPGLGLVRGYLAGNKLDRESSFVVGSEESEDFAANMGLKAFRVSPTPSAHGSQWQDIVHTVLDAPRTATAQRRTRETTIRVDVDLDRPSDPKIHTGIGFFDHMLEQLGKHGGFSLQVQCDGDLDVDEHHTVEDVAIVLGTALRQALGAKAGIGRYGFVLPMDEACAQVSIDLSGRPYFVFDGAFSREAVGGLPTELVGHFFRSLSDSLAATLHLQISGDNDHHKIEGSFKAVARSLRQAFRRDGDELPSTKGAL